MSDPRSKRLALLFLLITVIHLLVIFGPLAYLRIRADRQEQSEFAVELMGELLKAEEVGPPERLPDAPTSEPETPTPPEPETESPTPEPETPTPPEPEQPPAPTPTEPDVKLPDAVTEFRIPEEPRLTLPQPVAAPKRLRTYREPTGTSLRLPQYRKKARVAHNTNPLIPVGTRELGQIRGKPNNVPPGGGGATNSDGGFGARVGAFLKIRWNQPPRSLLGREFPEVSIELTVAADGRVVGKRILRPSGIPAMDESVTRLLNTLDRVPAPTDGREHTQTFVLKTEE